MGVKKTKKASHLASQGKSLTLQRAVEIYYLVGLCNGRWQILNLDNLNLQLLVVWKAVKDLKETANLDLQSTSTSFCLDEDGLVLGDFRQKNSN